MESYGIGQSASRFEDPRLLKGGRPLCARYAAAGRGMDGPNTGFQRIWTAVILSLRLHFNSVKTLQEILLLEFLQQFYSLTD